jgi:hypothetical protein
MKIATLISALLIAAATAGAITVEEYARSLDRIGTLLERGQIRDAHAAANVLLGAEVSSPMGTFRSDETLLRSVLDAKTRDIGLESRLAITAAELRAASPSSAPVVDSQLLERIEREQSVEPLTAGGQVLPGELTDASVFTRIANWTRWAINKVIDLIWRVYDWLREFWPNVKWQKGKPTTGMQWIIGAMVVLIIVVIAVLAVEVIRRSRRAAAGVVAESAPIASARDADPLSRGANEWERYAGQLAAAGRIREAIRAWYHAVLVTLYGAGILTFRKGRTNWEYVSALSPELTWRGEFVSLTRRFEQEWYGSERSAPEALADCSASARQILDRLRGSA